MTMVNKFLTRLLVTLFACIPLTACSIPAEGELEFLLSNGDKFILVNEYDYQPGPPCSHCTSRVNGNGGFIAYFEPKGGKRWKEPVTGTFSAISLKTLTNRQQLCARFGLLGFSRVAWLDTILDVGIEHSDYFLKEIPDAQALAGC